MGCHARMASFQASSQSIGCSAVWASVFVGGGIGLAPKDWRVAGKYINKNLIKITKILTLFILHAKIISTNSLTRGYE